MTEKSERFARAFPDLYREAVARGLLDRVLSAEHDEGSSVAERAPSHVGTDLSRFQKDLRIFSFEERARIAMRELDGVDVALTAREVSSVAAVCVDRAVSEALAWADERLGEPRTVDGHRIAFAVWGMGKLGGFELNVGSDIDIIALYETDDGACEKGASPHEYFTRVVQRFVQTLDKTTEDGIVFRVDLRLRPEGTRGPLVNSEAAMEAYYETWGRTWERAALLRARAVAGDLAFGSRTLESLGPFVWRKAVVPSLSNELGVLVRQARATAEGGERNIKLGRGGIREVEFFAQSLALVWGGKDPTLRVANTWELLDRLRSKGLVSKKEAERLASAYRLLRRVEHAIQFATGRPTHVLPEKGALLDAVAFAVGRSSGGALTRELARVRASVHRSYTALLGDEAPKSESPLFPLWEALDEGDEDALAAFLETPADSDFARHFLSLAERPDSPLGRDTRIQHPRYADVIARGIFDAPDPERCALSAARLFGRFSDKSPLIHAFAVDLGALDKLMRLLGASPLISETLLARPLLLDDLFGGAVEYPGAQAFLDEEIGLLKDPSDVERFLGALRRAKSRTILRVALDDLAGATPGRVISTRLSELAETQVVASIEFARAEKGMTNELAVVAMGKLGGRELSYGSDLDLFFVHGGDEEEWGERSARVAQRALRLMSIAHGDGIGYELDTRLRPSGNQGLLVVSLHSFIDHHASSPPWERQALVKGRVIHGDAELVARLRAHIEEVAFLRGAPPPDEVLRIRERMERELSADASPNRFDLKLGRGGLIDIEFATQYLQMKYGENPAVRTHDTEGALRALVAQGLLDHDVGDRLLAGYARLRSIERALRLGTSTRSPVIERAAVGILPVLARLGVEGAEDPESFFTGLERLRESNRADYSRIVTGA